MSAPAPLREVLDEVIQQLEEELSEPCQHSKGCGHVAAFLIVHRCCGFQQRLCDRHTEHLRGFLSAVDEHHGLDCMVCRMHDAPLPEIVPLGGAS